MTALGSLILYALIGWGAYACLTVGGLMLTAFAVFRWVPPFRGLWQ